MFFFYILGIFFHSSFSDDLGYRYDPTLGTCINAAGKQGMNPDFIGECGALDGADLRFSTLPTPTLRGASLNDSNLSGIHFAGIDLTGARLRRANLSQANLSGVNLDEADLTDAVLQWANGLTFSAKRARLDGADFSHAVIHVADLSGASLVGATFNYAGLQRVTLTEANLSRSTWLQAETLEILAQRSTAKRTALRGIRSMNAWELGDADLSLSDLTSVKCSQCTTSGTRFKGTRFDETTSGFGEYTGIHGWESAGFTFKPSQAGYHGYRFTVRCENEEGEPGFNAGYLGECGELNPNHLTTWSLSGLNLRGAKLEGAILPNADFSGSDLSYANLRSSNFSHASFVRARLVGTLLQGADLSEANLTEALLEDLWTDEATLLPDGIKK